MGLWWMVASGMRPCGNYKILPMAHRWEMEDGA